MNMLRRWYNAKSAVFSRLCGDDFTNGEVVCAFAGTLLFLLVLGIVGNLEMKGF